MSSVREIDWPVVSARVADQLSAERLHPAARARLEAVAACGRGKVAVAFSGGADSLALLFVLANWPGLERRRLLALHFNHRLRGVASDADAVFCQKVCAALGVECVVGCWERPSKVTSEAGAREARMAFFSSLARRRRIAVLCTGHHLDDVAETLLMRVARGSGSAGLSAPRPVHAATAGLPMRLRPLLTLRKADLVGALGAAGAVWRQDATNATLTYARNRLRANVIPAWVAAAEAGRDALTGAGLTRELLEEDDRALEIWAARVANFDEAGALALAPLRESGGLPRAVLRRAVRAWLTRQPVLTDLSRAGFEALLDFVATARSGARFSLGARHFAVLRQGYLRCERRPGAAEEP